MKNSDPKSAPKYYQTMAFLHIQAVIADHLHDADDAQLRLSLQQAQQAISKVIRAIQQQ